MYETDRVECRMYRMRRDADERCIIEALDGGSLCTEDLLQKLKIEPGGGETVLAIRSLMNQGVLKRHKTFIYELDI